ncbi:hypothetical protein B0H15DRAFT_860537 [Mycena belliarum]|uniref:Uncharacterized protein n=1 Tax=Mycena belliarum TaxID=1033014 RepID=A0AAD6TW60_9AGAR|nr:hypothetical protein B0H15DRAFT_860537 [Mycena belliae]
MTLGGDYLFDWGCVARTLCSGLFAFFCFFPALFSSSGSGSTSGFKVNEFRRFVPRRSPPSASGSEPSLSFPRALATMLSTVSRDMAAARNVSMERLACGDSPSGAGSMSI